MKKIRIIKLAMILAIFTLSMLLCGFIKTNKADAIQAIDVPIIMYHNVRKSNHGKFTISPEEFKKDLVFLKENGYNTVFIHDLISFVYEGTPLPQNAIVLTFDDGNYGVYKYAYPLLKEYSFKAVLSIIGNCTDKYSSEGRTDISYPHFTWKQINELIASGVAEIQNHSYNLHSGTGACKAATESEQLYAERLKNDILKMQNRTLEMTKTLPSTFTYPFGKLNQSSERIIKEVGFKASLSCFEGINKIRHGDMQCLYSLKRYNRPHGKGLEKILNAFKS